jgi:hypothetical protein
VNAFLPYWSVRRLSTYKNIPIHINGQFFNDGWISKHPMAKYELGEVHIKGTGVSAGIRYVFE